MASPKNLRKFRSWSSMDSEDPNDVRRLYSPERPPTKSPGKCVSTWTFSLVSLGFAVLFLIGLFVGYYVRESQNVFTTDYKCNDFTERPDKLDESKLKVVHENVMYYLSAETIQKTVRDLYKENEDYSSDSAWDKDITKKIKNRFKEYGIDETEVNEYNVVVTYPDPLQPNRLEVISTEGHILMNVSIGYNRSLDSSNVNQTSDDLKPHPQDLPYVAFSPGGVAEGEVVYGHYGSKFDLEVIRKKKIPLKDRILLLRLGQSTVYEKIQLATDAGAVGVLLYHDPKDKPREDPLSVPYVSARGGHVGYPILKIPAQTVSMVMAKWILGNITGEQAPTEWHGDLNITYHIGHAGSGTPKVRLIVNNKQSEKMITNVVGTLFGSMETDRYVMVGASRNSFPDGQASIATAILLELAQSLSSIQKMEKWRPRRGIKLVSWGGGELSNLGLTKYLQANHHLVQEKAVAYIDLDLYIRRGESSKRSLLEIRTSALLSEIVSKAGIQVPDPLNPSQSVAEDWKGTIQSGYHDNIEVVDIMEQFGIPAAKPGFSTLDNKVSMETDDDVDHDSVHHYKYHLSAARVLSLVMADLADSALLSHNIAHYTKYIYKVVKKTAQGLHLANKPHLRDMLLSSAIDLKKTGQAFQDFTTTVKVSHSPLTVRKLNDVKMLLEKLFTCSQAMCTHAVYVSDEGTWRSISEAVTYGQITGDWSHVNCQSLELKLSLDEAIKALQLK